jgi:hypothetical protein
MGRSKKSKAPKLLTGGAASYSPLLQTQAGSGIVTVAPRAVAPAPAPSNFLTQTGQSPVAKGPQREGDTAGAAWGHMRAPTLTTELKRDLLLVKMRGAMDPKRFYRSADNGKSLPKYFQMGTIVSGADEGTGLSRRERKTSILHELMSDGTIRKRAKAQFLKSQEAASAGVKRRIKPAKKSVGRRHSR